MKTYLIKRKLIFILLAASFIALLLFKTTIGRAETPLFWYLQDFSCYRLENLELKKAVADALAMRPILEIDLCKARAEQETAKQNLLRMDQEIERSNSEIRDCDLFLIDHQDYAGQEQSADSELKKCRQEIQDEKLKLAEMLVYFGRRHPEVLKKSLRIRLLTEEAASISAAGRIESSPQEHDEYFSAKFEQAQIRLNSLTMERGNLSASLMELSKYEKVLEKRIGLLNSRAKEDCRVTWRIPVGSLLLMLAMGCLALWLIEKADPYIFSTRILLPDRQREIIFLINHGVSKPAALLSMINCRDKEMLLIDLYPEGGLFHEFSSDGSFTLEDYLAAPGRLDFQKLARQNLLFYFPVRLGSGVEKSFEILKTPIFHTLLVALRDHFSDLIVHLPPGITTGPISGILNALGKVKVVTPGITASELQALAPSADVLVI
ncbi:MAG: hypothetical protein PHW04_04735 [Candidatus Wallbacteria bacterium]|nr:hypothetical protein [Candidatus Wallbacteria bacterium]